MCLIIKLLSSQQQNFPATWSRSLLATNTILLPVLVCLTVFGLVPAEQIGVFAGLSNTLYVAAFVISVFLFVVYIVVFRTRFFALAINIGCIALVFLVFGLYYTLLSDQHPLRVALSSSILTPGELAEQEGTNPQEGPWYMQNRLLATHTWTWQQNFGGESLDPKQPKSGKRIFVLGGSQAWGSGAADTNSTFSEILENKLQQSGFDVEVFNSAMNAVTFSTAAETNYELLPRYQPDIIVFNVGTNDSASYRTLTTAENQKLYLDYLEKQFIRFSEYAQQNNVDLVLVKEAMSKETYGAFYPEPAIYEMLDALAAEHNVPVIDPRKTFDQLDSDYMFWWDIAHLTQYGQLVLADLLYTDIKKILER